MDYCQELAPKQRPVHSAHPMDRRSEPTSPFREREVGGKKALKGTDDFLASNTTEVKRHLASTFERMQDEDKIPKSLRLVLLASEEELHSR